MIFRKKFLLINGKMRRLWLNDLLIPKKAILTCHGFWCWMFSPFSYRTFMNTTHLAKQITKQEINGPEVCELLGTFILNRLKNVIQSNMFCLHRDDELADFKSLSCLEIERLKRIVDKIFKDCGLNVIIEANLHTVDTLM